MNSVMQCFSELKTFSKSIYTVSADKAQTPVEAAKVNWVEIGKNKLGPRDDFGYIIWTRGYANKI